MLTITIPKSEMWDEVNEEFSYEDEVTITLEHSLVSLSKWESKWHKAFLGKQEKTYEETLDYIKCMTITKNVDNSVYKRLTKDNIDQIDEYINNPMTATYLRNTPNNQQTNKEVVTSELIYYWMITFGIPVEFEKWHLNKLIALIRVCEMKNSTPKKRSRGDIARSHAAINAANRAKYHTKG